MNASQYTTVDIVITIRLVDY